MNCFVFVYGTLKKGFKHHEQYMRDGEFISKGTIKGFELFDTPFGYPTIVPDLIGEAIVHGEMYRVDGDIMDELEYLEGTSIDLFIRIATVVALDNGKRFQAWVYVCGSALEVDSEKFVRIESGEWVGPVEKLTVQ